MFKIPPTIDNKIPVYWFVIAGLIVLAIITSTCWLAKKEDAVAYISFAATITSLVLGVIAIFYSMVTNNQSSENIGAIKKASEDVSQGSVQISNISNSVSKSVESLTDVSNELQKQLQTIPKLFEEVKDSLGKTESNIIGELKKEQRGTTQSASDNSGLTTESVQLFIGRSSFSGLIVLYALHLSLKHRKYFIVEDLAKKIQSDPELYIGYYNGYLIASASMGIVTTTFDDTKVQTLAMHEECKKLVPQQIKEVANRNDTANASNPMSADLPKWIDTVKAVEAYFGEVT